MCHEQRTWRNSGQAQEPRRDLWQDFEEATRPTDAEPVAEAPQPPRAERAEETVGA